MSILWQEQVISAFQAISHGILPAKQEPLCCCAENSYLASYTLELPNKPVWWNKCDAYALYFYRSQKVLGWSKFFVPGQKFIYILWQTKIGNCAGKKVFEEALNEVKFLVHRKYLVVLSYNGKKSK